MATDNVTINNEWAKVVDTAVTTFTLSVAESFPWEVALGSSVPAASVRGHKVVDADRQVTRAIGSGHVYARTVGNESLTLVRSSG